MTLAETIEIWLQDNEIDCQECKHSNASRFNEHCRNCINNIGIILNFEKEEE